MFEDFIVPITIGILIALFLVQHRGTSGIGKVFGPIMIVWFALIAMLGLPPIAEKPGRARGAQPVVCRTRSSRIHRFGSLLTLGSVFLAITGAEALYADMGHFGRDPIRLAWFALVLPTLLVNYFGQGALLLADPSTRVNPFFIWRRPGACIRSSSCRDGRGDRLAGDHLRRVLDDAAGDSARLLAALRHSAHVGARDRPGRHARSTGC